MTDEDIFEDKAQMPKGAQLQELDELVARSLSLDEEIAGIESVLSEAKVKQRKILEEQIPAILKNAHLKNFTTDGDYKIEIKEKWSGTIALNDPRRREQQLNYLRKQGAASLISNQIIVDLDAGSNDAGWIKENLDEADIDYEEKEAVNAQSLWAWARERLKNGLELDMKTMGLFVMDKAKITPPKAKDKK